MTTPRTRRSAGAAVGVLGALLVLAALFTLGGHELGDPAGRPETVGRTTAAGVSHGPVRAVADRPAVGAERPQLPGLLPVAPVTVGELTALLGLAAVAIATAAPDRPLPVRSGRGPPRTR